MTITAAADGSALGNPGPAGWAWYVGDGCWAAGGWPYATNNRGELQAVLELFHATAHLDDDLLVLCDSQYVINSVTKWMRGWKAKGWRKSDGKAVMNVDLLQELDAALEGRRYRFEWVKGHANHPLNDAADRRARAAAEAFRSRSAVPTGPGWHHSDDPQAPERTIEPARKDAATDSPPRQPGLFDFDDDDADADADADPEDESPKLTVTVELTAAAHARLAERAHTAGISAAEFLRRAIGP